MSSVPDPITDQPVTVRPAAPDEYAAIGALTAAAYLADGHLHPGDDYLEWLADGPRRAGDGEFWVAEMGGVVVGAVLWCPPGASGREVATDDTQGEFRTLAVDPDTRGLGIGTRLVEQLLALALRDGLIEVVLSSAPWMESAHRIYTRLGFVRRPELDWWPRQNLRLMAFSRGAAGPS